MPPKKNKPRWVATAHKITGLPVPIIIKKPYVPAGKSSMGDQVVQSSLPGYHVCLIDTTAQPPGAFQSNNYFHWIGQ